MNPGYSDLLVRMANTRSVFLLLGLILGLPHVCSRPAAIHDYIPRDRFANCTMEEEQAKVGVGVVYVINWYLFRTHTFS